MSHLKVRKIEFQFPDDIPLQWNPQNPHWGNFVNFASMIGPPFERYVIRAIREGIPDIHDPKLKTDAELFCQQEAQHSRQHLAHMNALIKKYPGLEETRQQVQASYEKLLSSNDRRFHLAYSAIVELMFAPFARFVVINREPLMAGSDSRVASLLLWHLVEEFEHRNAAYDVYNQVVNSYWFRLKSYPKVIMHIKEVNDITAAGFEKHIPESDRDAIGPAKTGDMFKRVNKFSLLGMLYELLCTMLPYHRPDNMRQPEWVTQWFADETAGKDMRNYYPAQTNHT